VGWTCRIVGLLRVQTGHNIKVSNRCGLGNWCRLRLLVGEACLIKNHMPRYINPT